MYCGSDLHCHNVMQFETLAGFSAVVDRLGEQLLH